MAVAIAIFRSRERSERYELRLSLDPERLCKAVFLMAALISAN